MTDDKKEALKVIQKEIIRDLVDRKQRTCQSATAWVNSSQRKVENGLFAEFTKKREVKQAVGCFPVDQQVQFYCGFVSPGSYCVSETSLNMAESPGWSSGST